MYKKRKTFRHDLCPIHNMGKVYCLYCRDEMLANQFTDYQRKVKTIKINLVKDIINIMQEERDQKLVIDRLKDLIVKIRESKR